MTKTFASLLFLTVVTTGCENSRSKLDDMAPAKLPKALQIDSVAAASADHSGTTEDRLARIENTLAKYREPLEFLSKVYEQQQQQADQEARREHAPDAMFAVPVAGDLEVGMVEGPSTAYVTIVKAFDFACPYCMKVNDTMHELVKDYGGKVRVVYKNLVVHPETATMGHLASCAAAKQHKYLEFKDAFWTNAFTPYAQSRGADADKMGKDHILAFSKDLGLDTAKSDPTGTWSLEARDFEENGRRIGSLRLPTLVVQEGGYRTRTLGTNARRFFEGLHAAIYGAPHAAISGAARAAISGAARAGSGSPK